MQSINGGRQLPPEEIEMHFRAAKAAGQESACGLKLQHQSLDGAEGAARSLNRRNEAAGDPKRFEAYPCPFCSPSPSPIIGAFYYHVGRKMTDDEREQFRKPDGYTRHTTP
jgi:hypothetical protein